MIDTTRKLTIDGIYELLSGYMVGVDEPGDRYLDEIEKYKGEYRIDSGTYLVRFNQGIPVGRVGYVYPSRELIYSGAFLQSMIYSQGDSVEALLYCPRNIRVVGDATIGYVQTFKTYYEGEVREIVEEELEDE